MDEITALLERNKQGDEEAFNKLYPMVYGNLKKMAHRIKFHWSREDTMNTTALVHELYLKLAAGNAVSAENRLHFYGIASKAMRQILYRSAEKKAALKRSGNRMEASVYDMDEYIALSDQNAGEIISINDALTHLEKENPVYGKIVEYRFFGGLSIEETAKLLETSPSSVKRKWAMAKIKLFENIKKTA